LAEVLKGKKALQDHWPAINWGQLSHIAVVNFLNAWENFADIDTGGGTTKDSRCIDVTIRYCGATVQT
jgi:hypothetical protein